MSEEKPSQKKSAPSDVEFFTREGIEDDILYEVAFGKAREFDQQGPPSSILEEDPEFVASAILGVALASDLEPIETAVLRDLYDGLMGRGSHKLKIVGASRGRILSGREALANEKAGRTMLRLVDHMTDVMGKREAAVSAVASALKLSRATVFARMKVGREAERRDREISKIQQFIDESSLKDEKP